MKISIRATALFILAGFVWVQACKKDAKDPDVDCSKVTGATFESSAGKMKDILATKCGGSACHAAGGPGSSHYTHSSNYDAVKGEMEHCYEHSILHGDMPPAGAAQLTQEEIDIFVCWKQAGFPK